MNKAIIVLHGWNSHLANWKLFNQLLKKQKLNVFQPTLPGFGKTRVQKPMATNDYVQWLKGFINQKKITSVVLIGHSFGGQIAIQFTAAYPQLVTKLVLIDSAGLRPNMTIKKLFFLVLAKLGKLVFCLPLIKSLDDLARKILYKAAREGDYFKASPIMKQTLKLINREDQTRNLNRIKTPALILWGEKDTITPLKDGRQINALLANSKLIIFPAATHGLPFQQTKKVIAKILWFIS